MARIEHRTAKLTMPQQRAFLEVHVPGRIRSIQSALEQGTYRELAAAAIFSRAIANFLGIGTRSGRLYADRKYFQHADGQKALKEAERSWIKWRDDEAMLIARVGGAVGGSGMRVDFANAQLKLINRRIEVLSEYLKQSAGN